MDGLYGGTMSAQSVLQFGVFAGVTPPQSGRSTGNLFPYLLRVKLSEFGYDFEGAMLTDRPDMQGTVYGLKGVWDGGNVAGLHQLTSEAADGKETVVSVHDGRLYVGVRGEVGDPRRQAHLERVAGRPGRAVGSPHRRPPQVLARRRPRRRLLDRPCRRTDHSRRRGSERRPGRRSRIWSRPRGPHRRPRAAAADTDADHSLAALLRMSQFVQSKEGYYYYYDQFQAESMQDFYAILQHYMSSQLRKQFFNPNPPPLDPGLRGISEVPGKKGTDPKTWYGDLSVAYTSASLSKWSTDPGKALLNERRADAWLSNQTAVSDVMQAQRYIAVSGDTGWTAKDGSGASLTIAMVTTKPGQLKMANIDWFTYSTTCARAPRSVSPAARPGAGHCASAAVGLALLQ